MGRTVIDLPMKEVIPYLNNHQKRKEWDKYVVVSRSNNDSFMLSQIKVKLILY